jgi:cell division protease FtsH
MQGFPWFPFGYGLPGGSVGPLRNEDVGYQVVATQEINKVALIVESGSLVSEGVQKLLDSSTNGFSSFECGGHSYLSRIFDNEEQPVIVRDWPKAIGLPTSSELSGLGRAIGRLRETFPTADVGRAIFLSKFNECLPVVQTDIEQDLRSLATDILVAGATIATFDASSIRAVNAWLMPDEIETFLAALGIDAKRGVAQTAAINPSSFALPGRLELELFFRKHIFEWNADRERYSALGVGMPKGILLYGPPGSGKSHAVAKVKEALGWPCYEIDLSVVGSAFIYQTSHRLRNVFLEAKQHAPALVVLEELDAFAPARGPMTPEHKSEEITTLLKLIERASDDGILVIATTNRKEALDQAIVRAGRFDHEIEVGYPNFDEVYAALEAMLNDRPHSELPNLEQLALALVNRPLGDMAWVVNEAARRAARAKKDVIDEIDLFSVLNGLRKN